jgi:hypothetical protein
MVFAKETQSHNDRVVSANPHPSRLVTVVTSLSQDQCFAITAPSSPAVR